MTTKGKTESSETNTARGFRLLEEAGTLSEVTLRDDQMAYAWLLDAARAARRGGRRFRLVDSGKLEAFDLEWLAASGADLYTSDDIRPNVFDLVRIRLAGRAAGAVVVFFHHGPLEEAGPVRGMSLESLQELLRSGVDVHMSNRERERPIDVLRGLADSCRTGEARLVTYHHGELAPELETLAEAGAWIHIQDAAVDVGANSDRVRDISRAGRRAGGGLILHMEKGVDRDVLKDLRRAGSLILNKLPTVGSQADKPLPFRSYYLDTTFMP